MRLLGITEEGGDLVVGGAEAVAAGDPAGFATQEFQDATAAVDEFCGA